MKKPLAYVAAVVTAAGSAVATLDANRPAPRARVTLDAGTCRIPDCRRATGRLGWDPAHAPVDCLAYYPGADAGRWVGCVVQSAEVMRGSACLPARCAVVAGEEPLEEVP